ncbi:superoxide dismutase [Mn], mitochondrial isoform X1 [Onthophagus taurus]|uniref:superoxide dismutase [Mn], mitochondrial isoform X1 n=1 Tax=Onthophagus taurus TaxID=166361 RepID=UPI000C20018D|nr:superoxide dismutase [Mn], mitochondrial [Onthophagus taurus]
MFTTNVLKTLAVNVARAARKAHTLPELPYAYEALEPVISRDIMCLHHQKHHQAYVTNLNAAEEKLRSALEKCDVSGQIAIQSALKFNGGGHINHSIFWKNLTPNSCEPTPELCQAISTSFGDMAKMKEKLSTAAVGVQGSGWAWLGYCKQSGCLKIATCANQDPLEGTVGLIPLFGIDVWEHAYYLQYKNVRADYVKAIFDIVNWNDVSQRYTAAKK